MDFCREGTQISIDHSVFSSLLLALFPKAGNHSFHLKILDFLKHIDYELNILAHPYTLMKGAKQNKLGRRASG